MKQFKNLFTNLFAGQFSQHYCKNSGKWRETDSRAGKLFKLRKNALLAL